ncbi:hypothetical protein [Herbaspirillum rhizosphaerae]|uniref:hypothetical protein n=1 Tax=Herbaspirillum rhizosphaerae TaxID=346179 RepID=UPI000A9D0273|nr:hypothetical protein [Herbaspirillum rhizosphaerae]
MNNFLHHSSLPFIFVSVIALSGCGNMANMRSFSRAYQPPTQGERAKIRVVSTSMVRAVPESDCIDWRKPGSGVMVVPQKGFANLNNQSLNMPVNSREYTIPADAKLVSSELYIPANKPFTLHMLGHGYASGMSRYTCQKSITFLPGSEKSYEAVLIEIGRGCSVELMEILSDNSYKNVPAKEAGFCRKSDSF